MGVRDGVCTRGVVGMERDTQGSGHGPELLEFKEHLDNILRYWD